MLRNITNDRSAYRHKSSVIWQKCTNLRTLKQVHASMLVHGFNSNPSSLREFIFSAAVSISSTIDYAHQVFAYITQPDTFMWNSIIRGSARSGCPLNAILLYGRMEKRHVSPDRFTFLYLFKACTKLWYVKMGFGIHGKVVKFGFEENSFVRNALINFHSSCGDLSVARKLFDGSPASAKSDVVAWSALTAGYARRGDLTAARRLFDEMPERDLVSWNVMITGYAKRGDMETARRLFDEAPRRDVVMWNVMLSGYVSRGSYSAALELFNEMTTTTSQNPDEVTILSLLSACAEIGDLEAGMRIRSSIPDPPSVLLGNALVNMYSKSGSISKALKVFDKMRRRDLTTWNTAIHGLANHGQAEEALSLFEKMLSAEEKINPDEITFVGVFVACSHSGKVTEGQAYFNLMTSKYKIKPNLKHYGCMVDILGRAGLLREAFEFVKETMEVEPNSVVWRALLGACRVYGDVEIGRLASDELRKMRVGGESGDYVLLSNIYASRGEWGGAEKVRRSMDDCGVVKEAGYSLIETSPNNFNSNQLN